MVMTAAIRSARSAELAVAGLGDGLMLKSDDAGQRLNYFGQTTGASGRGLGPKHLSMASADGVDNCRMVDCAR